MCPAVCGSSDLIGQSNFSESFSDNVVQQHLVSDPIPHGTEFDTAGAMQNELKTTTVAVAFQLQFAHRKMVFKKILFAAKSDVYEVAKVIQGTDFYLRTVNLL